MTYNYGISMQNFEWNENKRLANLAKHGLDFIDASLVFEDCYRIEQESLRNGEMRYQTLGIVNDIVVLLVYTYRGNIIRVISFRIANKKERNYYFQLRSQYEK